MSNPDSNSPNGNLRLRTYLYASIFIKICLIGFALDVYIELLKHIGRTPL